MSKPKPKPLAVPKQHPATLPEATTSELIEAIRYENPTGIRDLVSIHPNPSPTRALDAHHVVDLARSIAVVGLIEPLVIDIEDVVIAGSHRYAALRLLQSSPEDRLGLIEVLCPGVHVSVLTSLEDLVAPLAASTLSFHRIPVHIVPFSKREHPDETWRIEVAENEQRRDYKPSEVKQLAERLKVQGYVITHNAHVPSNQRAMPVLTALVGKSERHIRRLLKQASEPSEEAAEEVRTNVRTKLISDSKRLKKAIESFKKAHTTLLGDGDHSQLNRTLVVLERLAKS